MRKIRDNLQVAEFRPNPVVDNVIQLRDTLSAMKQTISFRATSQDSLIIRKLAGKLGIKASQVIKIALRRFAEAEGLRAS